MTSSHFTINPLFGISVKLPILLELEYQTFTISDTSAFKSLSDLNLNDWVTPILGLFVSVEPVNQVPPPDVPVW